MIRSGIYTLGIIVLTGILVPAYAQPGTDTTWKRGGNIGINLSQVSLSQWAAGGDNAVGFNLQFNYFANYKKAKHLWNNRLELDYGLNKTKSDGTKKTGLQRPSLQPPGEELSSAVKSFPTREISELPRVNTSFPNSVLTYAWKPNTNS